ncbi:MAG: Rossmann-like and DUF2520 domain-containing protein [Gemmatimonadota bacterium]
MRAQGPSVFVYGAGRVGLAIANLARREGVPMVGLWNPRPLRPERARLAVGLTLAVGGPPLPAEAEIWLVATPDDAIAETGKRLAASLAGGDGPLPRCAAHCAGAHTSELLAPLARVGVPCGSWHPAMTFRGAADDPQALARAVVAIEGVPAAAGPLEALAEALGLVWIAVAAARKADYHAALVLAANGRVALDAAAARLLREAGLDETTARSVLGPLVERVEENLRRAFPEEALTGPVARGDVGTVRRQMAALADRPDLLRLYRSMGVLIAEAVPDGLRGHGHREVMRMMREGEEGC